MSKYSDKQIENWINYTIAYAERANTNNEFEIEYWDLDDFDNFTLDEY